MNNKAVQCSLNGVKPTAKKKRKQMEKQTENHAKRNQSVKTQ